MIEIIFATNNKHKFTEVRNAVDRRFQIRSLKEIGCFEEIPETGSTLESNASQKANFVWSKFRLSCFADDTGLEIEALNGRPGVFSARYAGPQCKFDDNIRKVLTEMKNVSNRKAVFRTVIVLILQGREYRFEGRVGGEILSERRGAGGFGYDPVFLPDGSSKTFAEMPFHEKNLKSHRALAIKAMVEFLKKC